jgi:tetratricopeptide (TPR) repeat protein
MTTFRQFSFLAAGRPLALLFLVLLILNGCAAPRPTTPPSGPGPVVVPPPPEYKPVTGPAAALFSDAETALQAGRLAEAAMLLERALRIEPRNPYYWHTMAQVKYRQGQYRETVQFCLKAASLAGKESPLIARNKELQEQAKKAMQAK